jgi:hypothetical protein
VNLEVVEVNGHSYTRTAQAMHAAEQGMGHLARGASAECSLAAWIEISHRAQTCWNARHCFSISPLGGLCGWMFLAWMQMAFSYAKVQYCLLEKEVSA